MYQLNKRFTSIFFSCIFAFMALGGAPHVSADTIGAPVKEDITRGGHHGGHHHGHHGHHRHHGHHHHRHHGHHHHGHHGWNHDGWNRGWNGWGWGAAGLGTGYWAGSRYWNGHPGYYYDPNYYYDTTTVPVVPYQPAYYETQPEYVPGNPSTPVVIPTGQ